MASRRLVFPWPLGPTTTVAEGEGTSSTWARFRKSPTLSERRRTAWPSLPGQGDERREGSVGRRLGQRAGRGGADADEHPQRVAQPVRVRRGRRLVRPAGEVLEALLEGARERGRARAGAGGAGGPRH